MSFVTVSMNPAQASNNMRREIERLLQDVVPVRTAPAYIPAVNGYEDANGFRMEFEVPGFEADQLEVTAQDGALIVRGSMQEAELAEGTRPLFVERSVKSFERKMRLPKSADVSNITANHTNGVLTINVAKLATVAPRKVAINTSSMSGSVASGSAAQVESGSAN